MRRVRPCRRNPLDPKAWEWDPQPTMLKGPTGLNRPDDRRGVHVTPDFGLALWYATAKILSYTEGNIPVIFELYTEGLQAFPDFDAEVERTHTDLKETAYYVLEEMSPASVPGYLEREAAEMNEYAEEQVEDITSVLKQGSKQSVYSVMATAAENDIDGFLELMRGIHDHGKLEPLEWYAEAIQQWRYFDVIGLDRLISVTFVKPFHDDPLPDWDDVEIEAAELREQGCLDDEIMTRFAEDVLGDFMTGGASQHDFVTKQLLVTKPPKEQGRIEYHGTDLLRAREIFPELKDLLISPWNIKKCKV